MRTLKYTPSVTLKWYFCLVFLKLCQWKFIFIVSSITFETVCESLTSHIWVAWPAYYWIRTNHPIPNCTCEKCTWQLFGRQCMWNGVNIYVIEKTKQGAAGVEPATSRSAVECSATELYPRHMCSPAHMSAMLSRFSGSTGDNCTADITSIQYYLLLRRSQSAEDVVRYRFPNYLTKGANGIVIYYFNFRESFNVAHISVYSKMPLLLIKLRRYYKKDGSLPFCDMAKW